MQVTEVQECLLSSIRALTFERDALSAKVNELREVAKSAAGLQAALDAANEELKVRRFENKQAQEELKELKEKKIKVPRKRAVGAYTIQEDLDRACGYNEYFSELYDYLTFHGYEVVEQ